MQEERLRIAKERLKAYYKAEMSVLTGQEYRIGTRTLRRADLEQIRKAIAELEGLVNQLENQQRGDTSQRVKRIVLRDI